MATTNFVNGTVVEPDWLNDVDAHVYDQVAPAHAAANISVVPTGTIAATTVQAAVAELDGDVALKAPLASPTFTGMVTIPAVPAGATTTAPPQAQEVVLITGATGSAKMPNGTTAQRDGSPQAGWTRWNSTLSCNETYSGTNWVQEGWQSGAEAALAGTAFDFTGVPPWASKVHLEFFGLSTNGTSEPLFQLITSAAVTSGYSASSTGTAGTASSSRSSSAGVQLVSTAAANVLHGKLELSRSKASAFRWWIGGEVQVVGQTGTITLSGYIDLGAGVLTGIRATTTGGVNTFDAGTGVLSWSA